MAARCRGFASSLHPYCSQESVSSPEVRMFIFWVSAPETQRGNLEIALFHETSSTTMRLASYFPRTALRSGEKGSPARPAGGTSLRPRQARLDLGAGRRIGAFARAGDRRGGRREGEPAGKARLAGPGGAGAKRAVRVHGGDQSRHETVAGADRVDHRDLRRARLDAARAEIGGRAAGAARDDGEKRSAPRPVGDRGFRIAIGIEPKQIFVARLDEARERELALDQSDHFRAIRRHQRPDVWIEAGRGGLARFAQRGDDSLAVARVQSRDRADMQMAGAGRPLRWKGPGPVERRRIEIEGIARAGLGGAAHDESERRRLGNALDEGEVDSGLGERGGESLAIGVFGQARDESGRRAEAAEADRDIVRRAAKHHVIGAFPDAVGNEIDQRLAGNEYHAPCPSRLFPPPRTGGGGPCEAWRRGATASQDNPQPPRPPPPR